MAFELGSIIARIKADTSNFDRGLDNAKRQLGGFNDRVQRGAGASRAFAAGIAVVGTALGAAAGFAVKSAAGIESTHTAFTTMLKDGDKASALMKELNTFAAETPFEFPELADAGKKLLAFGFSAEEIQPNLRRLGDVAAGLGIPIGELSELYGKAKTQGRLYMEDINQLTGRGIPIIAELARQFGVSEAEVRGLVETGKIGYPQLEAGIKHMTDAGGMFAGGMLNQSKTLNGMISTLKDNIGAFARDLVGMGADGQVAEGSIFARVRDSMAGLLTWLDANKDKIKQGITDAIGFISTYAPVIVGVIVGILIPAFFMLGGAVAAAAGISIAALLPFIAVGAALGAAFMLLKPHFDAIWQVIQTNVIPAAMGLFTWLQQVWGTVQTLAGAVLAFLMPSLMNLWNVIVTQLWPALQQFVAMIMQVWNSISPYLIPALQFLAAILGGIIVGAIFLVINAFSFVIGIIAQVIGIVARMGAFFSAIINAIIVVVTVAGAIIGAIFAAVFAAIVFGVSFVGAMFAAVFNTILAIVAGVVSTIGGLFNMLLGIITSILSGVVNVARNLIQGNMVGAFQAAINAVKGVWGSITGFFSGLWSGIVSGVSGVGEGIVRPFRQAVDTIKNLMDGAKGALDKLNPFTRNSPSLVDWIKKGTGVITDQYDRMSQTIASGTEAARQQTLGTSRSLANVNAAEIAARTPEGGGRGNVTINVEGVLADSPEAKRKLGVELVTLINDDLSARGAGVIPT